MNDRAGVGIVVLERMDHAAVGKGGRRRRIPTVGAEDACWSGTTQRRGGPKVGAASTRCGRGKADTDRIEQVELRSLAHRAGNGRGAKRLQPRNELARKRHRAPSLSIS
jgi:hypothetical protein